MTTACLLSAPCRRVPPASCAPRPQPPATCCSAHAALLLRHGTIHATSASQSAAARARRHHRQHSVSDESAFIATNPVTWRSRCGCRPRQSRPCRPDGRARRIPRSPTSSSGQGTLRRSRRRSNAATTPRSRSEAARRRARVSQCARPCVLCLRAGLGGGGSCRGRAPSASPSGASAHKPGGSRPPTPAEMPRAPNPSRRSCWPSRPTAA